MGVPYKRRVKRHLTLYYLNHKSALPAVLKRAFLNDYLTNKYEGQPLRKAKKWAEEMKRITADNAYQISGQARKCGGHDNDATVGGGDTMVEIGLGLEPKTKLTFSPRYDNFQKITLRL